MKRNTLWLAVAATLAGTSMSALSQEGAREQARAPVNEEHRALETVVVTAQRRAEAAKDVPLALSVIGGDDILRSDQIKTTNDIVRFVPNAHAEQPRGPSRARWFIRGIGTNNTGNNTINPVGIYYDDVYIANISSQGFPIFDLDNVVVLNGPQGTLWGKNSNGGAINYVSKAPSFEHDAYAKFGYGSDGEKLLQGAVGGEIVPERVAGRFSFYYDDLDGWQKNIHTGEEQAGGTEEAFRGQLLVTPTDTLDITFNVHTRDFSGLTFGTHYVHSDVTPLTGGTATQRAFLSVYPTGLPETGYDETSEANSLPEELKAEGAFIKVNWDLGFATLTSITAYENNELSTRGGAAPVPETSLYYDNGRPFSLSYATSESDQWSEEIRLTSPNDGKFKWLTGLYAFSGDLDNRNVSANYIRGASTTTANAWGTGPQYTDTIYFQETESYAVFGNAGYEFTDRFKLSAGVRWSHEKISIDWDYSAANTAGTAASFIANLPQTEYWLYTSRNVNYLDSDSQTSTSVTWDITPEYRFSDALTGYARIAHGVLPGGFTSTGYVVVPGENFRANQIYKLDPEEIDAYELGAKTNWLDQRLTVDLAGFYYDYKNLVVNVPTVLDPTNPTVATVLFRNAGAAEIYGFELRANALLFDSVRVGGNIGLLHTEYTEDTGTTATILGAQAPRSPKATASFFAEYRQELPWGGSLIYGVDGNWRDKYYYYPTVSSQKTNPDPLLSQDAFALFNASLGWSVDDSENLTFQFSVQNLTDEEYTTHGLPISNGSGQRNSGRPRSYLLSVTTRF